MARETTAHPARQSVLLCPSSSLSAALSTTKYTRKYLNRRMLRDFGGSFLLYMADIFVFLFRRTRNHSVVSVMIDRRLQLAYSPSPSTCLHWRFFFLARGFVPFRRFLKDRFGSSAPPPGARLSVVAQDGCYHGDTLGAMDVAVPSVFNEGQHAW